LQTTEYATHKALGKFYPKIVDLADSLALNAGWDNEMLTIELNDLLADGFALEMLGFDPVEMQTLVDGGPDFEPATLEDQGKLDELDPKWIDCPHCGKEFDARQA